MWLFMLVCFVIGVVTESFAQWQKLWAYKHPMIRVCNVLVVFTLLFGFMSYHLQNHLLSAVLAGAVWGVVYEVVNDRWVKGWRFLGNPRWLIGPVAVYGVGVAWGAIVPIAVLLITLIANVLPVKPLL